MVYKTGNPGGPGRGNKKVHAIDDLDFWASTELMIKEAMKATDQAARLKAISLYIKWKELKAKHDGNSADGAIIDPAILTVIGKHLDSIFGDDILDVDALDDDNQDLLDEIH